MCIFKSRIFEKGWDLFGEQRSWGPLKGRTREPKDMSKLVLGHLSSRVWFLTRRVSLILLGWPFGLFQGVSVLTPPTIRSGPSRALAEGFESGSGQPTEDHTRVGFDGLSCPRPASCWSSIPKSSQEAGPVSINSFATTLETEGSSGLW